MSGLKELQQALPRWVEIRRHPGTPEVAEREAPGMKVTEVYGFPEADPEERSADLHFVRVVPKDLPEKDEVIRVVREALGQGEFAEVGASELYGGPSYITLGAWLGSQDLALMLIGATELAGLSPAITPARLGITGEKADLLAGNGFVMLGPVDWETGS